jgi:NAD(P)-dependent dehydrogenase (short-subunit alcohol dehydrogenase family)
MAPAQHSLMALKRHGRTEEVASMVAYLARDEAGFVTGANFASTVGFAAQALS